MKKASTRALDRTDPPAATVLSHEAIEALAQASHGDPFAVLGPHRIGEDRWEIRAMLPQADAASVVSPDGSTVLAQMQRAHVGGLFVGTATSRERPAYRIAVEGRAPGLLDDAYAFGPTLTDAELDRLTDVRSDSLCQSLGAHFRTHEGVDGATFAVWAPNARRVSVVGDWNEWDGRRHPMRLRHRAGVWELFIPALSPGARYKFEIVGPSGETLPLRADPVAFAAEQPPATASILHDFPSREWQDEEWMAGRRTSDHRRSPISIYECHLGSWARVWEDGNRYLSYAELAEKLIPYVRDMGFTHIELLPITEFPFDGSWGYQPVSLFAPTSRFGSPEDFAAFVDAAHRAGIGIILDWVPAHFPRDAHGLGMFDGTHLYEHADPRQGFHQDWGTNIYNFGRAEVATFLVSNARYWVRRLHLDGLRVDAVASMLYLDYSRRAGEWIPNRYGGNENLDAIEFIRRVNESVYADSEGAMMIAEESTAWPGVSQPTYAGGLGFGFKWNMGWMHDTLRYMQKDPIYRRHHHDDLTFGLLYAFSENFVLPLSHDEVVHGKGSLIARMPGDAWRRFANLRVYLGFMWGHPGKKLLFMGCEFAQEREWSHDRSLDWHLLDDPAHRGIQSLVRDLNRVYRETPALYERDCEASGFKWIVGDDREDSVVVFARFGADPSAVAIIACNFTPVAHDAFRVGAPLPGFYREVLNTDAEIYGGTNFGNAGGLHADATASHGEPCSLSLRLPPLGAVILVRQA
jgi:1,4-alpha-glucan branching enzyme